MNDDPKPARDGGDPEGQDSQVFELLDGCLERLHAQGSVDRESVLREHPELASAVECLVSLEELASLSQPDADEVGETMAFAPADEPMIGDFGEYELLEEIARGGMGIVYKARQKKLDRIVAVKMILSSHLASSEHVRRFHVEARAAARLRHPNIVAMYDVGEVRGQHYFAMQYVAGMSLAERLAAGPVDGETAARLVARIARAVQHLHEQETVHRDLKPSNILLDEQGEPYVTDFGLAKVFEADAERTVTGVIAGTPSYMSPEQAAGRSNEVGPASDVYSLGAILYELLAGRPPFREPNRHDTLMKVIHGEPALPRRLKRNVPRALERICLKCLAKNPAERYRSAADLAEDLERFARKEPIAARPPNLAQRLRGWARRKPSLALHLGALGAFYVVELFNYHVAGIVDAQFHGNVTRLIGLWVAASLLCQYLLDSRWASVPARLVWGILDSVSLLAALLIADGAASPLVVGYPLLIVGSAMWFRERFVWFITAASLASYGLLVVDFYYWRPSEFRQSFDTCIDRHIIFMLALILLGLTTASLVRRVRALERYYGKR